MATALDPPESSLASKRKTYGSKTLHPSNVNENNLLFDDSRRTDPDLSATSPVRKGDAGWRQRLAELDVESDEDVFETSVEVMRARLRGSPSREGQSGRVLPTTVAPVTGTSSPLSTAPVPTSSQPELGRDPASRHPSGALQSQEDMPSGHESSGPRSQAQELSQPAALSCTEHSPSPFLSDDHITPLPKKGHGGPKPLSKADQRQMQKDIAQAERERPVHISRPKQDFKPVSAWLKNATVAAEPSSSPGAGPGSDDIQPFTPSSAIRTECTPGANGCIVPASSSPSKSTPTRRTKQLPGAGRFSNLASLDDEEDVSLDSLFSTISKREALDKRKRKAMEKRSTATFSTARDDADSLDVVMSSPAKAAVAPMIPNARDIINRAAIQPAPSRQKQQLLRWSGNPKSKNVVTETHVEFAARKFGHAELRRVNAGSRPPGQKEGRDEAVRQAQVDHNLLRRHQDQISVIIQTKEEQYGGARQLPPKQRLAFAEHVSTLPSRSESDSDSDEDYTERASAKSSDEGDSEGGSDMDQTVTASSGRSNDQFGHLLITETETEQGPVAGSSLNEVDDDDDDEPKLRYSKRIAHRVDPDSDEEEPPSESHQSPRAADPAADLGLAHGSFPVPDLAGFGSAGGFSQLFGQTQQPQAQSHGRDAFARMRDTEPGFLPAEALLPSANVSESQALRDRALIAGEAEAGDIVAPNDNEQVFLNSQGFFTQTRPENRISQPDGLIDARSSTPVIRSAMEGSDLAPSSTVLNSSMDQTASPVSKTLKRLRRRPSSAADLPLRSLQSEQSDRRKEGALATAVLSDGRQGVPKDLPSRFFDEQAEESDEDDGWFLPTKENEDESDDQADEDGYVKELVDDSTLSAEERRHLALQAADKHREIAREDDARLEAEAKKVTEGFYRTKRRGNDFMSDDEDDDGKPRKLNKKQRRQRRLDREDGLYRIVGEENKFLQTYEADLETDIDFEETPHSPSGPTSPMGHALSALERTEMLRNRGQTNRFAGAELFPEDEEVITTSKFAISRRSIHSEASRPPGEDDRQPPSANRAMESFSRFLADENSNPRRAGGGVSVVQRSSEGRDNGGNRSINRAAAGSVGGDSKDLNRRLGSSNSILMERSDRFGRAWQTWTDRQDRKRFM